MFLVVRILLLHTSRNTVTGQTNYVLHPVVQKVINASDNVSTRVGLGRVQQERSWFARTGSQT
jgi:hypothetical protein